MTSVNAIRRSLITSAVGGGGGAASLVIRQKTYKSTGQAFQRGVTLDISPHVADNFNMFTLDHSPVHSNPSVLGGTLVFRKTRVPAQTLLDYLNDGFNLKEFLEYFPSVREEDALLFLEMTTDDLKKVS